MLCFVHKCYYGSLAIPNVFKDYFHKNNVIHVYGTRSYDRLHFIIIIIINVKINVALSENASRTRYTIKIKLKLRK